MLMNRKKLIYCILKNLQDGQVPKKSDYDLDLEQWVEIAELIGEEGYAKNVLASRAGIGNKAVFAMYTSAKLTIKGIDFLEQNSAWTKTYKGLKEVRDWVKL